MRKKQLTKEPKVFYNGSKTIVKHCGNVIAICDNGEILVHCRHCRQWINVNNLDKKLK